MASIVSSLAVILWPMITEKDIFSVDNVPILVRLPSLPTHPRLNSLDDSYLQPHHGLQNPVMSVKATVNAWVVIVYPNNEQKGNLAGLVTLLQKKGMSAFLITDNQSQARGQILIGPELERDEANNISNRVRGLFHLKTDVVKYDSLHL